MTGTRPFASSRHISTTRLCSSWLSVGLSPVVPTGTRPCDPCSICQLTSPRKAASSSEPFLNGVTKAVKDPRNFVLAAMDFLPHLRVLSELDAIHTGSDGAAKGPSRDCFSRDFAAVLAHRSRRPGGFSILSTYSIK